MFLKAMAPTCVLFIALSFLGASNHLPILPEAPVTPTLMVGSADDTEYKVDITHSSVLFRIKHMNTAWFFGRFNKMRGAFKVDDDALGSSFVRMEVDTGSVDGNSRGRNTFLRGPDLLSAKEFPKINFESSKIEKKGGEIYTITGNLSFRGVTREVTFDAEHTGTDTVNPRFGIRRGFLARIDIKRSDYGMEYGIKDKVLGDDVRLIVSLEGGAPAK